LGSGFLRFDLDLVSDVLDVAKQEVSKVFNGRAERESKSQFS
jgi:hypothetical protein